MIVALSSFVPLESTYTPKLTASAPASTVKDLYLKVEDESIDSTALMLALEGYLNVQSKHEIKAERLVVIDFSKPSTAQRFYLINPLTGDVLHRSVVSHGRNSGGLYANRFSNTSGSHQSSLGFYRVGETYFGKHGRSLRLDGLDKGLNHKARQRAIVIHSADYAEPSFAKVNGYLGRSFGCPALPDDQYEWIVDEIKEGTLLFIYHPSKFKDTLSNWV